MDGRGLGKGVGWQPIEGRRWGRLTGDVLMDAPIDPTDYKWHRATQVTAEIASALGSFPAMIGSVVIVLVWALAGPIFHFSDTWQLVINTGTTIITFNMVFVIQNTQNRDGRAIQTKLDAILEALHETDDRLVGLEDLPEHAIREAQQVVRDGADVEAVS
jgi:low affinity Fe/Cu permease